MGDADKHFELLSGRAELLSTAGQEVANTITTVDAAMVFLTLTLLVPISLLAQLSFIFELITHSNAADAGLNATQVEMLLSKGVAGLCRLLGSKVPERSIFQKTASYLIQDADDRSASPYVKRRHMVSYLEADLMIMKFINHAAEKVVGSGLDNATVAGNFRDAALFDDDNADTARTIEDDLNSSNPLAKHRLKTLSRTSWWESASTRVVIEHDWNCGLVLTSLRSVAHAGVIRKNREKAQFITGAAQKKEEETKEKEEHEEDEEDNEEDTKQREGYVQPENNIGSKISDKKNEENDENNGSKTDKDSSPFSSTDLEHLGCAYVDCVGAVDHMIMMESYFDHMKAEGK